MPPPKIDSYYPVAGSFLLFKFMLIFFLQPFSLLCGNKLCLLLHFISDFDSAEEPVFNYALNNFATFYDLLTRILLQNMAMVLVIAEQVSVAFYPISIHFQEW